MTKPEDQFSSYFEYLKNRGRLGLAYRKYWLYPRLCRHLTGRVLDIGCGLGDFLRYRPDTIGVDVNPNAVSWCNSQGLRALLMQDGVLPFADHSFDAVVLDNVLEHIKEPQALLAEIKRVLKADGVFLVGVPGRKGYASDPDHKVFYNEQTLAQKLGESGFKNREFFHAPFKLKNFDNYIRQYCIYGVFVN
jgi:SAM-dependent methyltransferase